MLTCRRRNKGKLDAHSTNDDPDPVPIPARACDRFAHSLQWQRTFNALFDAAGVAPAALTLVAQESLHP